MIKSYWLRLFLFASGGALIALVASMLVKKKYEALVDIMIDQKPLAASIPMNNADQSVQDMLDFNRPRTLTTQVQQLTSYGIIQEAARKVAQQNNQQDPLLDPNSPLFPPSLMDAITISADATSDIISLRVRLTDPELAKAVAREIYIAFVEQNTTSTRQLAGQAIDFILEQYNDIDKQLKALDDEQTKVKLELNSPDLQTQMTADIGALNTMKQARDGSLLEMIAAKQRVAALQAALAKVKPDETAKSTALNPIYQRIQSDLVASQADMNGLLQRYTPDREEVKALQAKIDNLKDELAKTKEYIPSQDTTADNSARKSMAGVLAEAMGAYEGAKDRYEESKKLVIEKEEYLKKLPPAQAKLMNLNRQQIALERVYQAYADRLKTLQAAKRGRVTPTREVTQAVAMPDPVSPKVLINTMFGIVAGLIFGILSMLATEAKRQPIRSLAQLNHLAFRPVYRLVPELRAPFRGLAKAPPESYETLLANHLRSPNRPYRIAIVGLAKDSGASTTAINLAVAGARHGSRVLVVECDPRGALARLAGRQPAPGETVEVSPLIRGMAVETLLSLSGDRNPEILSSIRDNEADLTIVDLEPASKSAEYAFVAPHVDEVILLVRAGRTKSVEFLQAQQALKEAGCPQVTVAFTRSTDLAVVTESADASLVEDPSAPKSLDS